MLRALAFLVLVLAWAWSVRRMPIEMSIAHFLPRGSDPKVAGLLGALSESKLAATLVLDLSIAPASAGSPVSSAELRIITRSLADSLGRKDLLGKRVFARSGVSETEQAEIMTALSSYPPSALLDPKDYEAEAMSARLERTKARLASPLGPLVAQLAAADPLGAKLGVLERFADTQSELLKNEDGVLLSPDGKHAFVFVQAEATALDSGAQKQLLALVDAAFTEAKARNPDLVLRQSGVARYALAAEKQIRGDIERIGTLSTVGILLMFALLFRSLRMLLLGLVPLACGTMLGTLGTYLCFGRIHGLTLAFGSSLLGVGIDYAEHYYTHYSLEPEHGPRAVMRKVWPSLWLGALTTMVGLIGFAFADFPGALQMGVFSSLAVLGALLATRFFLPAWMPVPYARPRLPVVLERKVFALIVGRKVPRGFQLGSLLLLPLLAFGVWRARFADDMAALVTFDASVQQDDNAVQALITRADPGRFAVVVADVSGTDSDESAIKRLEQASTELEAAKRSGVLSDYAPLGALLHSQRTQSETAKLARESYPAFERALVDAGFVPNRFGAYRASLSAHPPLLLADALSSPLAPLVSSFVTSVEGKRTFVLPLSGVQNVAKLRGLVAHATVVDQKQLMDETYAHVRKRIALLLAGGLVFVMWMLWARYRTVRATVTAILPAIGAVLSTVALFGLLGQPLNILHVLGFALVLSMGVDYGIFVVDARGDEQDVARAVVSMAVATLTTLLSFGLLATSASPSLRALGLSISCGMLLCVLFCPMTWLLLRQRMQKVDETP
jgi:predicted exporter